MRSLILPVLLAAGALASPAFAQSFPPPGSDEAVRQAERGMLYLPPRHLAVWIPTVGLPHFKGYLIVVAGKQNKYLDSCGLPPSDVKKKYATAELNEIAGRDVWVIFIYKKRNPGIGPVIQQAQTMCQQP